MHKVIFLALAIFSGNAFADLKQFSCESAGLNHADGIEIKEFDLTIDKDDASLAIYTNQSVLRYDHAASAEVRDGAYHFLSIEHDAFSLILDLDEYPTQAVVNPLLIGSKAFGPFFFTCK